MSIEHVGAKTPGSLTFRIEFPRVKRFDYEGTSVSSLQDGPGGHKSGCVVQIRYGWSWWPLWVSTIGLPSGWALLFWTMYLG